MGDKKSNLFLKGVFLNDCVDLEFSDSDDSIGEIERPMHKYQRSGHGLDLKSNSNLKSTSNLKSIDDSGSDSDELDKTEPESELEWAPDDDLPNLYGDDELAMYRGDDALIEYEPLPKWFVDPDQWPKSTNLLCWRCNNSIRGPPMFVPLTKIRKLIPVEREITDDSFVDVSDAALLNSASKYREVSVIRPHGAFCSTGCAIARIKFEADPKITNRWQSINLLTEVYQMYTGRKAESLPEAYYPKEVMIQYCGSSAGVSADKYRQMNEQKERENIVLM